MSLHDDPKPGRLLATLAALVEELVALPEKGHTHLLVNERLDVARSCGADGAHLPADSLPDDKRFNPLSMNPYVLFKALPHARRYSTAELVRAMDLLLQCNQRLIFSNLDDSLILQQTLVQIVHSGDASPQRAAVV